MESGRFRKRLNPGCISSEVRLNPGCISSGGEINEEVFFVYIVTSNLFSLQNGREIAVSILRTTEHARPFKAETEYYQIKVLTRDQRSGRT